MALIAAEVIRASSFAAILASVAEFVVMGLPSGKGHNLEQEMP